MVFAFLQEVFAFVGVLSMVECKIDCLRQLILQVLAPSDFFFEICLYGRNQQGLVVELSFLIHKLHLLAFDLGLQRLLFLPASLYVLRLLVTAFGHYLG